MRSVTGNFDTDNTEIPTPSMVGTYTTCVCTWIGSSAIFLLLLVLDFMSNSRDDCCFNYNLSNLDDFPGGINVYSLDSTRFVSKSRVRHVYSSIFTEIVFLQRPLLNRALGGLE